MYIIHFLRMGQKQLILYHNQFMVLCLAKLNYKHLIYQI